MPIDPAERRRTERELESHRQEDARERIRYQRTLCTGCGLIRASAGTLCSLCAPQPEQASGPLDGFDPDEWQNLVDDEQLEQDCTRDAQDSEDFQATLDISGGQMHASIEASYFLDVPAEIGADSGGLDDEPDYYERLRQAFEDGVPVEKHHIFPIAFKAQVDRANLKPPPEKREDGTEVTDLRSININDYTVPLPRDWHVELTASWTREWREFYKIYEDPTRAQIMDQAYAMMEDYGFLEAILVKYRTPMYEPSLEPSLDLPDENRWTS